MLQISRAVGQGCPQGGEGQEYKTSSVASGEQCLFGCSGEKGVNNWTCLQLKAYFSEEHLTSCQPQSQQILTGKKATQQQKFKVKHSCIWREVSGGLGSLHFFKPYPYHNQKEGRNLSS